MIASFIFPWERERIIRRLSDSRLLEVYQVSAPSDTGYDIVVDELDKRTNPNIERNLRNDL